MKNNNSDIELISGDKRYTYFAFISYKREDGQWASWLQKQLHSYRLPAQICKRHKNLQERCYPVFLDQTSMRPGYLEDGLATEVHDTKYLIVLCSRKAHDNSKYIDLEIEHFLKGGGDPSRIIPFIIDNSPTPEKDCFPPKLQEICKDTNILGANVFENGKRNAFIKVVAAMHGLKVEEVESDDKRRRFQFRVRLAAVLSVLLLAASIGGYTAYNYYTPKTKYYLDYTEVNSVPRGIHPLKKEEISSMESYYSIVTRKNRVEELAHRNGYGKITDEKRAEYKNRPVHMVYKYTDDGKLYEADQYNEDGVQILVMEYDRTLSAVNLRNYNFDQSSASFLPSSSSDSPSKGGIVTFAGTGEQHTKIVRYLLFYDQNGFLSELRYVSNSDTNEVGTDNDNVSGVRYERDEKGRIVKTRYLRYDENGGSAMDDSKYFPAGTKAGIYEIDYRYDESDDLAGVRYLNENGGLVIGYRGSARTEMEYDEHHNLLLKKYFGIDDKPVLNSDGFFYGKNTYNDRGFLEEIRYYDTNNEPVHSKQGIGQIKWKADEEGRTIEERYYYKDGKPLLTGSGSGYHIEKTEYSDNGRCITTSYYDIDGNPAEGIPVSQTVKREYNEVGKLTKVSYLNPDGTPVAYITHSYDETGFVETEARIYDENEELTDEVFGYAVSKLTYDIRGNLVSEERFDKNGNLTSLHNPFGGYAKWTAEYDDRGNVLSRSFSGPNGEPVAATLIQCSKYENEYSAKGTIKKQTYYGTEEDPPLDINGAAVCVREFDDDGNVIKESYFDSDMKPVVHRGCAWFTAEYDKHGNKLRQEFFDADGNKGTSGSPDTNGYYLAEYEYYPPEVSAVSGFPAKATYYASNTYGNFLNIDGRKLFDIPICVQEYDTKWRLIKQSYYNEDKKPTVDESEVFAEIYEYDGESREKSGTTYLDINGKPFDPVIVRAGGLKEYNPAEEGGAYYPSTTYGVISN